MKIIFSLILLGIGLFLTDLTQARGDSGLAIFDQFIEKIIQISNNKKISQKEIFEELITPTYFEFKDIHRHYIESFIRYRKIIKGNSGTLFDLTHPVFKAIAEDNLFSWDLQVFGCSLSE